MRDCVIAHLVKPAVQASGPEFESSAFGKCVCESVRVVERESNHSTGSLGDALPAYFHIHAVKTCLKGIKWRVTEKATRYDPLVSMHRLELWFSTCGSYPLGWLRNPSTGVTYQIFTLLFVTVAKKIIFWLGNTGTVLKGLWR